jgi:hypothetical protein
MPSAQLRGHVELLRIHSCDQVVRTHVDDDCGTRSCGRRNPAHAHARCRQTPRTTSRTAQSDSHAHTTTQTSRDISTSPATSRRSSYAARDRTELAGTVYRTRSKRHQEIAPTVTPLRPCAATRYRSTAAAVTQRTYVPIGRICDNKTERVATNATTNVIRRQND